MSHLANSTEEKTARPSDLLKPFDVALHDETLCHCGADPLDEVPEGPKCECRCEMCQKARDRVLRMWAMSATIEKLEALGIDVDVLVSLVCHSIEDGFEERIEKIARRAAAKALEGVKLVSAVQWSTIND